MNNKKRNKMNKHLRKFAFCLSVLLAVSGCSQAPKEVNGQPVHEVPFEQPLVLKPETGQDFYFYIKGKEQRYYVLNINMVIPDHELQEDNISKFGELEDKWLTREGETPKKDALLFDIKAEYYTEDGITPIILKRYSSDSSKPNKDGWYRFGISSYASNARTLPDGKMMSIRRKTLARFDPSKITTKQNGIYKVSVKPVPDIKYPHFDLEFSVEPYYYGK